MTHENNNANKFCTNCGAFLDETNANFCTNCGTNFGQQNPTNNSNGNYAPTHGGFFNETLYCQKNGYSAEIKTVDWLKLYALNLLTIIPFLGTIVLFVIWLVLAFKDNVAKSIQNYARASLIFGVIISICLIILLIITTVFFASVSINTNR